MTEKLSPDKPRAQYMIKLNKEKIKNAAPEIIVFVLSIIAYALYVRLRCGSFMIHFDDGKLYISVADNFLGTGHFIKTERPHSTNMVVPFGLPLLLLPIRAITKSNGVIIAVQYLLYGFTNVLLYRAERNLFASSGVFTVLFFWLATFYRVEGSPAVLACTEVWYLLLLSAELYILSVKNMEISRKMFRLNILTFCGMAVRPFLSPLYIITVAATVYLCFAKKRFGFKKFLIFYIISSAILVLFLFVNHREVGQWVLFQNYAAWDIFRANNAESDPLSSVLVDYYYIHTSDIDYVAEYGMYKRLFREYVVSYPGKFIYDTAIRFYVMYVKHWFFLIVPVTASAVLLARKDKEKGRLLALLFALSLCMAAAASVDLICHRYTLFIVPLYGIICAGGVKLAAEKFRHGKTFSGQQPDN